MRDKAPVRAIECPSCGEHFCKRRFGEHEVLVPRDPAHPAGNCPFGDRPREATYDRRRRTRSGLAIAPADCMHDLGARMHELSLLNQSTHDGAATDWPASWSVEYAQCCAQRLTSVTKQARECRSARINCSACGRPVRNEATSNAGFCQDCIDRGLG